MESSYLCQNAFVLMSISQKQAEYKPIFGFNLVDFDKNDLYIKVRLFIRPEKSKKFEREMSVMKQRMQGLVIGVLAMTLLFGTVNVFAAASRTIEVVFGGVRTTLFEQEFVVRDDQGLVIESITYNDRVYIPVETVLHAMEANAQWNELTQTLNFGTASDAITQMPRRPLNELAPFFDGGTPYFGTGNNAVVRPGEAWPQAGAGWDGHISVANVIMGGREYTNATRFFSRPWGDVGTNMFAVHNLNGEHSILAGHIGRVDDASLTDATVTFLGDGHRLAVYQLRAGELPIEISIPVQRSKLAKSGNCC